LSSALLSRAVAVAVAAVVVVARSLSTSSLANHDNAQTSSDSQTVVTAVKLRERGKKGASTGRRDRG